MIQSFTGTFDTSGIRSLRVEADDDSRGSTPITLARFWVVLDTRDMPMIRQAMSAGDRIGALKLISNHSLSMGTILPE